ncbi:sister chromatid cohesion factor [Botrytis cinerea]
MDFTSTPDLPPTSDPALLEDWEGSFDTLNLPSNNKSDEVEAIHLLEEETRLRKNREKEVIQHRAWKVAEVFRSEADHIQESPVRITSLKQQHPFFLPSSPPNRKMPSVSSPIEYPQSSSPPPMKRPHPVKASDLRKPLNVGGFLLDDGSDVEEDFEQPAAKRRMTEKPADPIIIPEEESQKDFANDCGIQPSRSGPRQTVGGFMIDESDEENEEDSAVEVSRDAQLPKPAFEPPTNSTGSNVNTSTLPAFLNNLTRKAGDIQTCSGKSFSINLKKKAAPISFEKMVAARSVTKAGKAKKSYYGINISELVEEASKETKAKESRKVETENEIMPSIESLAVKKPRKTLMWTEKYRARHFMELCGDDRTHRQVLRWLKAWDPIVFPKSGKPKAAPTKKFGEPDDEKPHRKILLLTGPPGLGKTTLAHVCARQAGYEVMEINASDERSRDVVKGRIRTSVGTENVKTGSTVTSKSGHVSKNAHPLCVVVDEVDGVVGGSGGSGEGGFIKALIDLVLLDQKNSSTVGTNTNYSKKKKGDDFRLLRPLILVCNDVYHPSLRPLRNSSFAEIIHIRKPPLDAVVQRMQTVFEKEGVSCDSDAIRRLCEATWGISPMDTKKGAEGTGEGDLRSILVVGEWAAGKLRTEAKGERPRLTRKWVEQNMTGDLSHGGGGSRAVGRGGIKEVVNRVFLEGAGFPRPTSFKNIVPDDAFNTEPKTQLGVAELARKAGMERLGSMIETSGDTDRIMTDIFGEYPNQPFNDDSILSKPDAAYEWLHFHDSCSSRVFSGQEWELAGYLTQPVLAWHHLFASPARHYFRSDNQPNKKWSKSDEDAEPEAEPLPFTGPRADFSAFEMEKLNRSTIQELQAQLDAKLLRSFRSCEDIAMDLLPYVVRMISPEVKPIIVGGSGETKGIASVRKDSEKRMVKRAVDVMSEIGVMFERGRLEGSDAGAKWGASEWVYRMEPPLDTLVTFLTSPIKNDATNVRYAVRQVLDQEYQKNIIVRENKARQARYKMGNVDGGDEEYSFEKGKFGKGKSEKNVLGVGTGNEIKKDFFGRVLEDRVLGKNGNVGAGDNRGGGEKKMPEKKVWVTFHEGFSNAVRKPITIGELMRGL